MEESGSFRTLLHGTIMNEPKAQPNEEEEIITISTPSRSGSLFPDIVFWNLYLQIPHLINSDIVV